MILKAISLWQPWASLWAAGIKKNETRSWYTHFRGLLAVHAAKHRDKHAEALYDKLCSDPDSSDQIMAAKFLPSEFGNLPFGEIVGVVYVKGCKSTVEIRYQAYPLEYVLGDYSAGRFAWPAENARLFEKPIPCKGRQGFFNVEIPDDLL